jgi:hypothetical protein
MADWHDWWVRVGHWQEVSLFKKFCIFFTFTHMCIHCLGHLCHPPFPASRQNLFCPLVLWFCWRENIIIRKTVFLLVWNKHSYKERFLALLPCTSILQPTLVNLYLTFSLLPSPLPTVASANLRLLFLLLYSKQINHIQVLGFLPFPYSFCAHSPLSVWPISTNITAFILSL